MMKDTTVRVRVNSQLKLGLSMSEAITLFLAQIKLQKGLPFEVKIPNKATEAAITDIENEKNLTYYKSSKDLFKK